MELSTVKMQVLIGSMLAAGDVYSDEVNDVLCRSNNLHVFCQSAAMSTLRLDQLQ